VTPVLATITAWSIGVAIADPVGVSAARRLDHHLEAHAFAGWRVLGNDDGYQFPGPLAGADVVARTPWLTGFGLSVYAGAGFGVGWVRAGCYYDSVAEFCVDEGSPSFILRAPIGVSIDVGRLEISFEAVPAYRAVPEAHHTFLGGFVLRWTI
jgi:hypothetical protein